VGAVDLLTDRATAAAFRGGARVLGLSPRALLALPRGELRRLARAARRRAERELHRASLRLDALVAFGELLEEGRL